ncbi:Anaphase-promoting complex subunit Apc8 [Paramicrosporidium saccamoebae]|uniref:Anaphase-promoting complex subunit Apc8 n=1 Tax=Paramicrosporidium saccamoebae TaxID=1246581 RepID=A0A2H9TGS4_9FUNG|nr:Anaphase-promoting complex subunit Apc8 [Paramicrosporidium saccamoebae]
MYENRMKNYSSAFNHARESFILNPYCYETWEQLATAIAQLPEFNLDIPDHPMSSLFLLYLQGTWRINIWSSNIHAPSILRNLHFTRLQIAGLHYHKLENHKAEEIYEQILETHSCSLDGMDFYSDILFLKGQKSDLQELMNRAYAIKELHPVTCHISGNYHSLCGDHEKAAVYFRRATRLNPKRSSAWILAAQQYLELRQPEAAIDCYLRATGIFDYICTNGLEINPNDFRGWFGLGQIYELLDSLPLALEFFSRACRLAPNDHRAYTGLGNCFLLNGQLGQALTAFQKAIECRDAPTDVYLSLGAVYIKMKKLQEAISHFRYYLDSNPAILNSPEPVTDPTLQAAILSVAKDDQSKGDYLKATLWFSLLSRSHGQVRWGPY